MAVCINIDADAAQSANIKCFRIPFYILQLLALILNAVSTTFNTQIVIASVAFGVLSALYFYVVVAKPTGVYLIGILPVQSCCCCLLNKKHVVLYMDLRNLLNCIFLYVYLVESLDSKTWNVVKNDAKYHRLLTQIKKQANPTRQLRVDGLSITTWAISFVNLSTSTKLIVNLLTLSINLICECFNTTQSKQK